MKINLKSLEVGNLLFQERWSLKLLTIATFTVNIAIIIVEKEKIYWS
ncbi:hypothetical protein [Petrotoga sp. 9PWA.NaAc.5.4]|nr:hypothetical protein [Petrotoga sp. 9PWA.NaAc.5.4]